jgi:hypothetical protein
MDDLCYQLLSWLAPGNRVARPRERSVDAEQDFEAVVRLLERLRDQRLVTYRSRHVTRSASGAYLLVGPVDLTPDGLAALERDRRLRERPAWTGDPLPWRQ